jgi:small subunit ribosomal protein S2
LTLVTTAIIDGLANRTSDKEVDAPAADATEEVAPVAEVAAPAVEVEATVAPATEE